jgi:hypothetical protein
VESINFVCLGQTEFIHELGKKGQSNDITTYDKKKDNRIVTYVIPSGYPDKIQPLITAVNLAEYSIINVNKLDRYLGEQIITLDLLQLDNGFLLHSYEVDNQALKSLLKDTVLSSFKFEENLESLKESINSLPPLKRDGLPIIHIDNVFNVKGVGVVVLGILKQGEIKVHDELILFPQKRKVTVSYDQELIINFNKVPFYNNDLSENHSYLLSIGTQIRPAKIEKLGDHKLKILSDKIFSFKAGDIPILLNPDSKGIRIVGSGSICI